MFRIKWYVLAWAIKITADLLVVFNHDCRTLLKIKYFFTFLFVLRPIFVLSFLNKARGSRLHRRAGFMRYLIFRLSPPANLEGRVERYRNALSVLANFVKVDILQYIPILLVLRAFLHPTSGHFMDDAFRLFSLYYSVHHSWSARILGDFKSWLKVWNDGRRSVKKQTQ